jgi:hypothetical protein
MQRLRISDTDALNDMGGCTTLNDMNGFTQSSSHAVSSIPSILNNMLSTEPLLRVAALSVVSLAHEEYLLQFTLEDACRVLTSNWSVALCDWTERCNARDRLLESPASYEMQLLRFRISALELVGKSLASGMFYAFNCTLSLQQQISMWLSAHIPMHVWCASHSHTGDTIDKASDTVTHSPVIRHPTMKLSVGVHILPPMLDTVNDLDFYNTMHTGTSAMRKTTNCLYHVLSKALPRRCQIRELSRFIRRYAEAYPQVTMLIDRMAIISILGLYPTRMVFTDRMQGTGYETRPDDAPESAAHICDFRTMLEVCAKYYTKPQGTADNTGSNSYFAENSTTSPRGVSKQPLLLFMIQQLLMYQVQLVPALWVNLNNNCEWTSVRESVDRVASQIRAKLVVHSPFELCIVDFVSNIISARDRTRFSTTQVHRRSLRCTIGNILDVYKTQVNSMSSSADLHSIYSTMSSVSNDDAGAMGTLDRLNGRTRTHVSSILRSCHGSAEEGLYNSLLLLKQDSVDDYHTAMHVFMTLYADLSISVYQLPDTIWAKQLMAIDSKWERLGGIKSNPQASTLLVCTGCHKVKVDYHAHRGYVNKGTRALQTAPITGCVYVTVDEDNNRLMCNSYKKKVANNFTDQRVASISATFKNTTMLHCGSFALSRIHLVGNAVWVNDVQYSICTGCACITEICTQDNNTHITCPSCTHTHTQTRGYTRSPTCMCSVCDRVYRISVKLTTLCFYTPDDDSPLLWLPVCAKCTTAYKSMCAKTTHRVFTTAELNAYDKLAKCQAEYKFYTNGASQKRSRAFK